MREALGVVCLMCVVCSAAVVGCSTSSGGAGSDTGDSGTKSHEDSGAGHKPGDSGAHEDAGGSGSGTGGIVSFQAGGSGPGDDVGAYTIVGAFDQISGMLTGASPCGPTVDGCSLCAPTDAGVKPGNLMINVVSAGTLTVKDGSKTLATLPFEADAGGVYEITSVTSPALAWAVGDDLAAAATGGKIPAFSGSITAPHDFAGVTPDFSLVAPVTVATSGFTVSWTPSSDNGSIKLVVGVAADLNRVSIGCTVDESAGKIVVASSLLKQLAGFGDTSGTMSLAKTVTSKLNSQVSLSASPLGLAGTFTFSN